MSYRIAMLLDLANAEGHAPDAVMTHLKGLEDAPWKDPEYFKTLKAKFIKIAEWAAENHPTGVSEEEWNGTMVRQILGILDDAPLLKNTLGEYDMLGEQRRVNELGEYDRDDLWIMFDTSEEDAPDDVRAFVECHTLLKSGWLDHNAYHRAATVGA